MGSTLTTPSFSNIARRAIGNLIVLIMSTVLVVTMLVLYWRQTSLTGEVKRTMCRVVWIIGIVLCVLSATWIIFTTTVVRDAHNISSDASSIYVSRDNIVVNWYNTVTHAGTQEPISSGVPTDDINICTPNIAHKADKAYYDGYRELIAAFAPTGPGVDQTYLLPDGVSKGVVHQTIEDQRNLSLAYYRQIYCVKTLMQDIIDKNYDKFSNILTAQALSDLRQGKSCVSGDSNYVQDTVSCRDQDWDKTASVHCNNRNPCFKALVQTLAAHCLLIDDGVYSVQHAGVKRGSLAAFDVTPIQVSGNK